MDRKPYIFQTDGESRQFCDEIAEIMQKTFGVSADEAIGRINKQWRGLNFIGSDYPGFRYREPPDYWASRIYFVDSATAAEWERGTIFAAKPYP